MFAHALVALVVGVLAAGGGGAAPAPRPAVADVAQVGAGWQSWPVNPSRDFGRSGSAVLSVPGFWSEALSPVSRPSPFRSSGAFAIISRFTTSPTSVGPCLSLSGPEWDALPSSDTSDSCDPSGSLSVVATETARLRVAVVFGFALALLTLSALLVVAIRR